MDLLVLAKRPVPGRVKTRLCPPCSPEQAAHLAAAALLDTLEAARASTADRVVLAVDDDPGSWPLPGVEVVSQGTGSLSQRLDALWANARGPALQIGMDTPQVTPSLLERAMAIVAEGGPALGAAADGGWWAIGLPHPIPGCFDGVEPSRSDTGANQRARLLELGFAPVALPVLRDVDRWDDALAVAAVAPDTRFAQAVTEVRAQLGDRRTAGAAIR